jgi:LytS/YehU family sensor histidine kinase
MNPHFIFNALSNILSFIERNDNKKASNYLATFSKLLRNTLESTREDMVSFEKEVGTLRNYLELQKLRYGDQFDFNISVDEQIDGEDIAIPPMLVQPFIENAIEHGIRHKKSSGKIDVRFVLKENNIQCEVEDDGVGRKKAWEMESGKRSGHKSLATDIIRDRIQNLNKKLKQKIQLEIIDKISENAEATGTKVLLDLPYRSAFD